MFTIIILILLAFSFSMLATFLIRKFVKDPKKQKTWTIVADVLFCLLGVAGIVDFALFRGAFFNNDKHFQREWIYNTLPEKLWEEQTYDLVNTEYKRLTDVMADYANDQIRKYQDEGEEKDLNEYLGMSMLGLDDLYFLGGGSSSSEKKRAANIEKYKERYNTVTDNLKDYFSSALSIRNKRITSKMPTYSDTEFCQKLLGTPTAVSTVEPSIQRTMAEAIVNNLFLGRKRPSVSSSQYDRKEKAWNVRLDNAPNQVVRFIKRDDGDFDIEWTGNKGYVQPVDPAAANAPYGTYVDDEMVTFDPDIHNDGLDEEYLFAEGWLEDSDGKKYNIDMSLTIGEWVSEADGSLVEGTYHYASQAPDKQISLSGNEYAGKNNLSAIILETADKTERFSLSLDREKKTLDGDWFHFKDKANAEKNQHDKQYRVVLKYQ